MHQQEQHATLKPALKSSTEGSSPAEVDAPAGTARHPQASSQAKHKRKSKSVSWGRPGFVVKGGEQPCRALSTKASEGIYHEEGQLLLPREESSPAEADAPAGTACHPS
eukprot:810339-Pelagomonas_calceolata.AAC.2